MKIILMLVMIVTMVLGVTAQNTIPSYFPTNGLVGWWPFNQQLSNQVGSIQRFNNFGTSFGIDRNNNAQQSLKISQTSNCSQRLETAFPGDSIRGELTFSFWIRRDSSGCDNPRAIVINGSLPDPSIQVMWWNYSSSPVLTHADGLNSVGVTFRPVNNHDWAHMVYSNDGDSACFYQNGALIQKIPNTLARLFLGNSAIFGMLGMNYPLHGGFYGHIDDIAIYNRALSAAEVQQLYSGQSGCNLTVNLSNTDTLSACGNSVTLNAGNAGATYLWNNGSTNSTLSATQSGWYSVTVSQNNCTATDSVYVDLLSVDLGNDTSICSGTSINLNVNTNFGSSIPNFFNGNRFIETINNGPSGQTPRTYSMWVNTKDSSAMSMLFHGDYSTGSSSTDLLLNLDLWFGAGSGWCNQYKKGVSYLSIAHAATFAKTIYDGNWHHIAYVMGENNDFSHSNIAVYVDGVLVSRANNIIPYCGHNWGGWTYNTMPSTIKIGAAGGRSNNFNGQIAKIGIWDKALSQSEVMQAKNLGVMSIPAQLRNYYPLNQIVNDSLVLDLISGNNGIIHGAPFLNPSIGVFGLSYLWSTGDTTPTINVAPTQTTTYYCTIRNGITTCTDSIVVTVNGKASANLFSDTTSGCGNVILSAGNGAATYLWSTGATSSSIQVTQSGTYHVSVQSGGCALSDTTFVDLLSVDLGNDTSVCQNQNLTLSAEVNRGLTNSNIPYNVRQGLISYWPFDGDFSDKIGKKNFTNYGTQFSKDRFGKSGNVLKVVQDSMCNQRLESLLNGDSINGKISISFWLKRDSSGCDNPRIFVINGNLPDPVVQVMWWNNSNRPVFTHSNGRQSVGATFLPIMDGQWAHLVYTNDGQFAKFYQDGNLVFTTPNTMQNIQLGNSAIFGMLGMNYPLHGGFFGEIDEVAIYNRALTNPEIIQLNKQVQVNYLWSTGDTTPTINVAPTQTTTYYCTISNGITTCTDSIVVTVNGTASANLFSDTTSGCGNVILSAGNGAASYLWSTGDTASFIQVTQSGTYHVSVQSVGCTLTDTTFVDLISVDLGNDTSICAGQTYLINPFVQGNPNLKNGLMAAYSFDGNAFDFSGNGNHGKPQGVTPTTDRFGNPNGAYFFRGFGKNDHIFVANHPSMHIDSVYTMSLWYKEIPGNAMNGVGAYSPTNGTAALFAKEGDGIGTPPGFFADLNYNANGGYSLNYLQVDGCCGVRSKFQPQFSHPMQVDSTWKHLVVVNTKDYAETYINGVKVKFASMPSTFMAANRNNLYFGIYGYGKQSPFWYPFYGSMDEVMMYNRALDSNEIQSLYQLQNSQNAFSYAWSNGATTPFIGVSPAQTTTYYCTISNGVTTCTDSITIVVKPNPPVVALPDTLFQCGNPGRLDAGNPGATYSWSNKATTQSILPVNGGWYSVVVNQNGCTATDSSYVDLLTLDLGRDTGICIGSSITLSVQGQNLGNTTPDSIFVPTDASWKVSVLNPEGWEYVGFNDTNSFWPSAKIQGNSTISGAQPIWHPDSVGIYDAYFRKVFEVNGQPNPDFQLEISAENEYYAFVNGRFVGYGNSSMGGKQTYPIAQNLVQGYNSIAIFASNWGASTAQLTALVTGTTDKKAYLWTTGDTTSSITVAPTKTTTYYCTVTNGYTFCTDSIVVRVGTPQTTFIQATTCSNQPYYFGGRLISQPGVFVDSLRTSLGCDSVITLTLQVKPSAIDSISAKVCGNTPYIFGGKPLTQAGIYVDTLQSTFGCDSMVVLNLQFAQPDTQRIIAAICNGSSYMFNGQNLTQSGNYQARFINAQGCDSVVILNLNVSPNPTTIVNDTICRGQVYSFGGQNYSNSGQYSFFRVNPLGCTTTVVLNLVVNEIQKATISSNGSLEFCRNTGVTLFASGGTSYLWSTGSRKSSIQVYQSQPIWVEVTDQNGCVSRSDSQFTIQRLSVPSQPPTITGDMNPCSVIGTTNTLIYGVPQNSQATYYQWLLDSGITPIGRLDSNYISVAFAPRFQTGRIRIIPVNACGTGLPSTIFPRASAPNSTPTFTNSMVEVCGIRGTSNLATYSIQSISGCRSYFWTLPTHASLVSGQGTNTIQVSFNSLFKGGTLSVIGLSNCGNTPTRKLDIKLLDKPIVSGPTVLCPGSSGIFSVPLIPNATQYRFNLPSGLRMVSQNMNTAVIATSNGFVGGTLGVQVFTNNCGFSQPGNMIISTNGCRHSDDSFGIAVYPNPSKGDFQLQFGEKMNRVQVSLYSAEGRLVKRDWFVQVNQQNLSYLEFSEGLYQIEIVATDSKNEVHRKIEKVVIKR